MIIVDDVFLVSCLVLLYRRVSFRVPVGLLCILTRSSFLVCLGMYIPYSSRIVRLVERLTTNLWVVGSNHGLSGYVLRVRTALCSAWFKQKPVTVTNKDQISTGYDTQEQIACRRYAVYKWNIVEPALTPAKVQYILCRRSLSIHHVLLVTLTIYNPYLSCLSPATASLARSLEGTNNPHSYQ